MRMVVLRRRWWCGWLDGLRSHRVDGYEAGFKWYSVTCLWSVFLEGPDEMILRNNLVNAPKERKNGI